MVLLSRGTSNNQEVTIMYNYTFSVVRQGDDNDDCEFSLKASFEINDGFATIDGPIYFLEDDGDWYRWTGNLSEEEVSHIEAEAFSSWESDDTGYYDAQSDIGFDEDQCGMIDEDFFHDDRAICIGGNEKIFW
jgi:hypothetical protein